MSYKNILPTKRFDENFKEVEPAYGRELIKQTQLERQRYAEDKEAYNQAQQRKVLCSLSEFEKLDKAHVLKDVTFGNSDAKISQSRDRLSNYNDYITQPITEKSLEGVECVVFKNGRCFTSKTFMMGYFYKTQTIEDALSDGVLFILKD